MPRDHDPFDNPEVRHPRARELMADEALWDCVFEAAPFGSDEGFDAYYEYRRWRRHFPNANLIDCLKWILQGKLDQYNEHLLDADHMAKLAARDETDALLGLSYSSVFTLDTTIIATALGQLADEGRVDPQAKPYVRVALQRQSHPAALATWSCPDERRRLLNLTAKAIEAA